MYNYFFFLIVAVIVINYAWDEILSWLNRSRMNPVIPTELTGIYDAEQYAKQQSYQKENMRLSAISGTCLVVITLILVVFGLFGHFEEWLLQITDNFLVLPLVYCGVLLILVDLFAVPFNWYNTFVIEERYGFNKTTPALFIKDAVIELMMGLALNLAMLAAIVLLWHFTGYWFWILAWIVTLTFTLFMSYFYSDIIVPLFNKQEPLEEGALRTALEALAVKAGFALENIYLMDGSKRSTKSNAYFTGFGKKKRIVLYDTLLDDMDTEEIVAVLAHEIGHYKKHHIISTLAINALQLLIMFFLFSLLVDNADIAQALGGSGSSFVLGLIGFQFLYRFIGTLINVVVVVISRRHEYQADSFAASFGLGDALISGLKIISTKSLSNLTPHPLVVFWRYSHPTLLQRIKAIEAGPAE